MPACRFVASLVGLLFVSAAVHAADVAVTYPLTAPACSYVEINATGSHASAGIEWQLADQDGELWLSPDRRRALVRAPSPRTLQVILLGRDTDGRSAVKVVSIQMTGDAPPPPAPRPEPVKPEPVKPDPPKPDPVKPGRFGIAKEATEQAAKVETSNRKVEAEQIALVALTVRAQFVAGKLQPTTMLAVGKGIETAVATLPAEIQRKWLPTFGSWWTGRLRALWVAGQLTSAQDWIDVIDETVLGLRAVVP